MFQLTDTHWGYSGPANPNPTEAFERAVAEIASWPMRPELVVHTGDVTHMTTDAGARKARLEQAKALLGKLGSFLVYADASERPREEATSRGFHVITWTSGVGMALVSDVAWEDLHQLEARLRK